MSQLEDRHIPSNLAYLEGADYDALPTGRMETISLLPRLTQGNPCSSLGVLHTLDIGQGGVISTLESLIRLRQSPKTPIEPLHSL